MYVYDGATIYVVISGKSKIDLHIPCTDIIHINASKWQYKSISFMYVYLYAIVILYMQFMCITTSK